MPRRLNCLLSGIQNKIFRLLASAISRFKFSRRSMHNIGADDCRYRVIGMAKHDACKDCALERKNGFETLSNLPIESAESKISIKNHLIVHLDFITRLEWETNFNPKWLVEGDKAILNVEDDGWMLEKNYCNEKALDIRCSLSVMTATFLRTSAQNVWPESGDYHWGARQTSVMLSSGRLYIFVGDCRHNQSVGSTSQTEALRNSDFCASDSAHLGPSNRTHRVSDAFPLRSENITLPELRDKLVRRRYLPSAYAPSLSCPKTPNNLDQFSGGNERRRGALQKTNGAAALGNASV